LTYTVTHSEGTKQLGVQHFALTVIPDSKDAQVRLGSKVPIATGGYNQGGSSAPGQLQFQYTDVGLNISAHVREFPTGVLVYSRVEQTGLAEEPSGVGSSDPVIRQGTLLNTALLTLGKPVMLGSLDVPGSSQHIDIEVVLELVK
jgi:type II secretory pathway component GspD/PulD (secretin)